jgi:hypothetical protein
MPAFRAELRGVAARHQLTVVGAPADLAEGAITAIRRAEMANSTQHNGPAARANSYRNGRVKSRVPARAMAASDSVTMHLTQPASVAELSSGTVPNAAHWSAILQGALLCDTTLGLVPALCAIVRPSRGEKP